MSIISIRARQIFDSRSNPTVEVDVRTARGLFRASAPSGASTGVHEAVELRDGDRFAFSGKGVTKAVHNVNDIIGPALVESKLKVTQQNEIDHFMIKLDGTTNKGKLGANAIVSVSMAVSMAGAAESDMPLYAYLGKLAGTKLPFVMPCPALNVINGGKHAGNNLAFQEFMILPIGASSFYQAMEMATETYQTLKSVIKKKYGLDATNVGDEGGFAPNVSDAEEALDLLVTAIKKAGYEGQVKIGMDLAASEFYSSEDKTYGLDFKNDKIPKSQKRKLSGEQLGDLLLDYLKKYPIISIEDPFDQDDWESWTKFTAKAPVEVVADDLTVSNPGRIKIAIEKKACNALLLKINQIGTITESIDAAQLARSDGWGVMVSHRSGETENTFISDLVVGLGVGQIKTGAPARSERVAKYNNMIRIEEEIGGSHQKSIFAGIKAFSKGNHPPPLLKN